MILDTAKERLTALFPPAPESPAGGDAGETPSPTEQASGVFHRDYAERGYHLDVKAAPGQLVAIAEILFELGFFLESITGVDWIKEDELEAVYDFSRYDFELCRIVVRARTHRSNPVLPTITGVYSGANWHERETHDFFGITFAGHPHLIPLLLPEDADFHPLLKDFKA